MRNKRVTPFAFGSENDGVKLKLWIDVRIGQYLSTVKPIKLATGVEIDVDTEIDLLLTRTRSVELIRRPHSGGPFLRLCLRPPLTQAVISPRDYQALLLAIRRVIVLRSCKRFGP
jgi:hypothetical protein